MPYDPSGSVSLIYQGKVRYRQLLSVSLRASRTFGPATPLARDQEWWCRRMDSLARVQEISLNTANGFTGESSRVVVATLVFDVSNCRGEPPLTWQDRNLARLRAEFPCLHADNPGDIGTDPLRAEHIQPPTAILIRRGKATNVKAAEEANGAIKRGRKKL
ncbi:hypothetical protein BC835DRAFT_1477168 [Cytidiella melzeri]|nr:hypothetical protein BC835DRAFT_1477168 [Cytidiella melzeri]